MNYGTPIRWLIGYCKVLRVSLTPPAVVELLKHRVKWPRKYLPEDMTAFSKTVARHGRCSSSKFWHVPQGKFRPINTANSANSLNLNTFFLKNWRKELTNQQHHFANPQMQNIGTDHPNKKPIRLKVQWAQQGWSAEERLGRLHRGQTASRWDIQRRGSLIQETLYWLMDGSVLMSMD